jgi:hypothetical protein
MGATSEGGSSQLALDRSPPVTKGFPCLSSAPLATRYKLRAQTDGDSRLPFTCFPPRGPGSQRSERRGGSLPERRPQIKGTEATPKPTNAGNETADHETKV